MNTNDEISIKLNDEDVQRIVAGLNLFQMDLKHQSTKFRGEAKAVFNCAIDSVHLLKLRFVKLFKD